MALQLFYCSCYRIFNLKNMHQNQMNIPRYNRRSVDHSKPAQSQWPWNIFIYLYFLDNINDYHPLCLWCREWPFSASFIFYLLSGIKWSLGIGPKNPRPFDSNPMEDSSEKELRLNRSPLAMRRDTHYFLLETFRIIFVGKKICRSDFIF